MVENEVILEAIRQSVDECGTAGTTTHVGALYAHVVLTDSESKFRTAYEVEEDGKRRIKFCRIGRAGDSVTASYLTATGGSFTQERGWEYEIMICRAYSEDGSAQQIVAKLYDALCRHFDSEAVRARFAALGAQLDPLESVAMGVTNWKVLGGVLCDTIQATLTVRVQP